MPCALMVAEQVSAQWVMEAHRLSVAKGMRLEDVSQPMEGVETRLAASVVLPLTEPNVVPLESELPLSSSVVPLADATRRPQ